MILLLSMLATATAAVPQDLSFEARGLASDRGRVLCTLYADAQTWLKDPGYVATVAAIPKNGRATCVFFGVAPGTYAISFIHDLNGNGDMDTNLLGLPKEPWGMSRDAPVRWGPPKFDEAKFAHPATSPPFGHAR